MAIEYRIDREDYRSFNTSKWTIFLFIFKLQTFLHHTRSLLGELVLLGEYRNCAVNRLSKIKSERLRDGASRSIRCRSMAAISRSVYIYPMFLMLHLFRRRVHTVRIPHDKLFRRAAISFPRGRYYCLFNFKYRMQSSNAVRTRSFENEWPGKLRFFFFERYIQGERESAWFPSRKVELFVKHDT